MDDLDAMIGDLLASDDDVTPRPKKGAPSRANPAVRQPPKKKDDAFYASLAAQVTEVESTDVSEADPIEMAKALDNLDDMEAALFKTKPTTTAAKPAAKSNVPARAQEPVKPAKPAMLIDEFEDYKDPLAVLDSKPKQPKSDFDDESSTSSSRRLEIDRPPTRSGKQKSAAAETKPPPKKRTEEISFDDDDVLGGMGLDSPRESVPVKPKVTKTKDNSAPRPGGAKSIFDDLLGDSSKPLELTTSDRREFTFDKKFVSEAPKEKETEEEYKFGGYEPSSAVGVSSRPSSHRSVRFEDDGNGDDFLSHKPSSAGSNRRAATFLEDMINKDDRDWLDIATDAPAKAKSGDDARPKSAGFVMENQGMQKKTAEPVDWLGLSRLGSPELRPADNEAATAVIEAKNSEENKAEKSEKENDDWLAKIQEKKAERKQTEDNDWLGLKDDTEQQDEPTEDYLGLGGDVDLDNLLSSKPGRKMGRRAEDLFSSPPKRDASADSLPWAKPSAKDQRSPEKLKNSSLKRSASAPDSPRTSAIERQKVVDTPDISKISTVATPSFLLNEDAPDVGPNLQNQQQQQQKQQQLQQQQQQMIAMQQQKYQDDLQRQMQLQQQQMQQQQEEQLQKIQQQAQMNLNALSMPVMAGDNSDARIRQLITENAHLQSMLNISRTQHQEEMAMLEDSYKRRIQMIEDSYQTRERRLKDENAAMSTEVLNRVQQIEKEKTELLMSHLHRQSDWERKKDEEINHLKEMHRQSMQALRNESEESLERVKLVKQRELEAMANAHDTTKNLSSVISQMGVSVHGLDTLSQKVEAQHVTSLTERERAVKARDEQLKNVQERLERQQHDTEVERARLQGLVSKLELQLTDQARALEEEKWRVRQEENRLKVMQSTLDQDRKSLMEQLSHERSEVEKAKDNLLDEQKSVMTQLSTERKQLAEERAHFNVAQRLRMEQEQRDTIKTLKADAEADSTVKVLNDEKAHLEARVREFELERKKFMGNQEKLEHEMKSIAIEKEKLEQIALQVRQRSKDIEEMCLSAAQAREEGQQALIIAKSTETEHKQRLNKIQVEVANLRSKERQIAEERLALAKEKKTLETSRSSMLCVSCRTPMKEVQPRVKMTPAAHNLYHTIENKQQMVPNLDPGTSTHNKISADIVVDKSFRNWRRQAAKDKEYLEEESAFLDVIKQSPYHSDASI